MMLLVVGQNLIMKIMKKIEKAYNKGSKTFKLNDTYKIDINHMIQFRINDRDRQRPIKREENYYF